MGPVLLNNPNFGLDRGSVPHGSSSNRSSELNLDTTTGYSALLNRDDEAHPQ